MTSEKALIILLSCTYFYNGNRQELIEAREKIVKDLEVLEILKKVFNYKYVQKFVENMTQDEFFKVKEWLENGKNDR